MPVLAHAGDWLVSLLFIAPIGIITGWLVVTSVREKRRETAPEEAPDRDD